MEDFAFPNTNYKNVMDALAELNLQEQKSTEGKTNRKWEEELMMDLMKRNQNTVVLGGEGNF